MKGCRNIVRYAREHKIQMYVTEYKWEWIKDWRSLRLWRTYFDKNIKYVEEPVMKYCETNGLLVYFNNGWMHCISNRCQYNDIRVIIDEVFHELHKEEFEYDE